MALPALNRYSGNMKILVYHNPRCSKSRQTLELIRAHGHEPEVIEYLKTPPDATTLRQVLKQLGISPRELLRCKETEYQLAGLEHADCTDDEIIAAMIRYPQLIERPIVVAGNKAMLGRPPEKIISLLTNSPS